MKLLILTAALLAIVASGPARALLPDVCAAQEHEYVKRLRTPATVKGLIGGESHNSYVIHAREGQVMTVQISWRPAHDQALGDNRAEFFVSESPDFNGN